MTDTVVLQKKARGERPQYFDDPAVDKVLSITMALAGEVAVMRERLDTLERLLEAGEPISRPAIDAYEPDTSVRADRNAWRETFLDVIFRAVHQELEDLQTRADQTPYEAAVEEAITR